MSENNNKTDLKSFLLKLAAIVFAIIILINVTYNLFFADKLENINKLFNAGEKQNIEFVKNKIRLEIKSALDKDKILNDEDKILLYRFYLKLKDEFNEVEEK